MVRLLEALGALRLLDGEDVLHGTADLIGGLGEEVAVVADDAEVVDIASVVAEGEGGYAVAGKLQGDGDRVFEVEAAVGVDARGDRPRWARLRKGCARC